MARTAGKKNLGPQILDLIRKKYESGAKVSQIARELCQKYTTVRAAIKRIGKTREKAGRKRKISPRLERRIVREVKKCPDVYSTELVRKFCPEVHPRTVRRCLARNGLFSCTKRKKPPLTGKQMKKRLKFCHEHRHKPMAFWYKILFSDESKVECNPRQRRRCWRLRNTALHPKNLNFSLKGSASSVMVWGCMSAAGVGTLHHITQNIGSTEYIDLLEANLQRSRRLLRLRDWVLQQDNAPIHASLATQSWLVEEGVQTLDWPGNSPDLNPIENLWDRLKGHLWGSGRASKPTLFARAQKAWGKISPAYCRKLVQSMPRRIQAVIDARGGAVDY